ncbi:hypothetical protein NFI96_030209 [Prochilodus magdalenae]|nr:hypothetical protein NFI96_030209 [Prochilodus magdalenae]
MTLNDFMKVLEKSLDSDKATEEQEEEELEELDTGVTIFFLRASKSISGSLTGMDDQIVKLQGGLRCLSKESCGRTAPVRKLLEAVFNFTKGTHFRKIHNEVISSVRLMLPNETREAVNIKTTYSLTSGLFDEVLKEMNSALTEINLYAKVWDDSVLTGIMEVSKKLLLTTMKRLQDFLDICRVCDWWRASRGSPVDIHHDLEAVVPPLSVKVAGAIVQTMLSVSSEGTSWDSSDTPLSNFLQAVVNNIKTKISSGSAETRRDELSGPSGSTIVRVQPSPHLVTIGHLADNMKSLAERLSVTDFLVEASQMVCEIINDETSEAAMTSESAASQSRSVDPPVFESQLESSMLAAASGLVSALVSGLESTFQEDFEVADPSADPSLYTTQVEVVSDKVLNSIQAKLKDVLVASFLIRANQSFNTQDDAQLNLHLLSASKEILRTVTDSLLAVLHRLESKTSTKVYERFLQTLREGLILTSKHLSRFCKARSDRKPRIFPVRFPKMVFRMLSSKNRIEPAVTTETITQQKPVPAEEPADIQAPTSAPVPFPKGKGLFSRVAAAFTRVFRKRAKSSS